MPISPTERAIPSVRPTGASPCDQPVRSGRRRLCGLGPAGALTVILLTGSGLGAHASEPGDPASAAAHELSAREAAIAGRLLDTAHDPSLLRLVDGARGATERRMAQRSLERLRGSDGTLVRNACLVRVGTRGRTPIDGGLDDPRGTACVDRATRDAVAAASRGSVQRALDGAAGYERLLLATLVTGPRDQTRAVLSIDIDLAGLLDDIGPADAGVGLMVIELGDSHVIAGNTAAISTTDQDGSMLARIEPLWPLIGDGRLGLMALAPAPAIAPVTPPEPASGSPADTATPPERGATMPGAGLVLGLAIALVVLAATGYLVRRRTRAHRARARVEALYEDAATGPAIDPLTDLPTRSAFDAVLTQRLDTYLAAGDSFTLAIIDVDDLRTVNERDGRSAGDEVLVGVAAVLRRMVRPEDQVFRISGDAFALVMPGREVQAVVDDLERTLHFSKRPYPGVRPASFSAGVSGVPRFSTDGDIVVRQAQAALAWTKAHGRGAVEAYDPERDHVPDQPHEIANLAVREVVAGKMLSPVFQPIVDLQSGRVLGFEGLIRPDPSGPLPDTGHLFAAASASGRTVELDLACVEVVLAGARAIGPDRLLTLNLSPRTLEVRDFDAAWLLDMLVRNGVAPGRVIVELTEREPVGDLPRLRQALAHLQGHGLRLAADDVGAGNAGLRLLSQVRFDIVKIDLSLVHDGVHQAGSRAVLESLRDLAISQSARIVAEGVETAEQLRVIRDLHIGAGQGYLLGRPAASVEATFVDLAELARDAVVVSVPDAEPKAIVQSVRGGAAAMTARPLSWAPSRARHPIVSATASRS